MSTLKKFKSLSNKQFKKFISFFLIVGFGISSAMTVAALSKDVTIKDGQEITKFRTLHSDTDAVLKQAGIFVGENDKIIRTDANVRQMDIDIKRAFNVRVQINNDWQTFTVNDGSVADLLNEKNIPMDESYYVSEPLDAYLVPNMQIIVAKLLPINISVDGETKSLSVPEGSVENALRFLNVAISSDDIVSVPMDKSVEDGMSISINRVEFKDVTEVEPIPFSTEIKKSDSLFAGDSKIETPGVNGEKQVSKHVKFVDGTPVQADVISENVLKNPVSQVKIVGTKPNVNRNIKINEEAGTISDGSGNVYHYNKILTGVCTAYTAEDGARTSTGAIAKRGIVAVNPKQIPYGTKLYIPNYGYCVAGDTGGAMRQGRAMIDLYMDSEKECRNFGRRTKQVYILD